MVQHKKSARKATIAARKESHIEAHVIRTELDGASNQLAAQTEAGLDESETLTAMYTSLLNMLHHKAPLRSPEITDLTKASNAGPWTTDQKRAIADILRGSPLSNDGDNTPTKPHTRKNQTVSHFENFCGPQLFIDIRDTRFSTIARAHKIAKQASDVGITNPSSPTLFRMVSLLAWAEGNYDMTQREVFGWMDKIQSFIKSFKPPVDIPYLETYPTSSTLLTPAMQHQCYPDGKLPVDITISELDTILADKKQRGRGNIDVDEDEQWLNSVPEKYKHHAAAAVHAYSRSHDQSNATASHSQLPPPSVFKSFSSAFRKVDREPTYNEHPRFARGGLDYDRLQRDAATALPHPAHPHVDAGEPAGEPVAPAPAREDPDTGGNADGSDGDDAITKMEDALLGARKLRATAAGGKAKAAPKKKPVAAAPPVLKRPAAAAACGAAKKRPAAAPPPEPVKLPKGDLASEKKGLAALKKAVDMKDIFTRLRAEKKDYVPDGRNAFCSVAYGIARRRAHKVGAPAELAKSFAGIHHRAASELYGKK